MRKLKSPYVSIAGWSLFLAGALSLASCSTEELIDKDQTDIPIKFGEVKTRAEVTATSQVREFGVFAEMNYLLEDGNESTDFISLLDNEKVYRISDDESADFTYDNKRYWVEDRIFNFFAVYPYEENSVVRAQLTQNNNTYDGYTISFTTPTTADKDLMVAERTAQTTNIDTYPTVDFQFTHALSKINIKVSQNNENEDSRVVIKQITFSGFYNKGTYNTSRAPYYSNNWEITGTTTMSVTKNDGWEINEENKSIETMGDGLLLIPQEINYKTIKIEILYDFYMYADTEEKEEENATATAYLPVSIWEEGKHYTYNIVMEAKDNNIRFNTPSIESWGSVQSGGTIIIK